MIDLYFKNEEAKIIFALVELEGKSQMKLLGMTYSHYASKEIAESWYEKIKEKIKNSEHKMKDVANKNLEKLYKGMI